MHIRFPAPLSIITFIYLLFIYYLFICNNLLTAKQIFMQLNAREFY